MQMQQVKMTSSATRLDFAKCRQTSPWLRQRPRLPLPRRPQGQLRRPVSGPLLPCAGPLLQVDFLFPVKIDPPHFLSFFKKFFIF